LWGINSLPNSYVQVCFSAWKKFAIRLFIQESYISQVAQLVAEHELQEELPPIGLDTPSVFLEKEAKEENIRSALLWQRGQEAFSFACLCWRSSSNLNLQSGQQYS